nr:MAG TPA: hypothetical protein [Caudoviricetes sp.]
MDYLHLTCKHHLDLGLKSHYPLGTLQYKYHLLHYNHSNKFYMPQKSGR